jgi:cupredoxin-like protein
MVRVVYRIGFPAVLLAAAVLTLSGGAVAQEIPNVPIAIKDRHFEPSEVDLPAGVKVKLVVRNLNATAAEFESTELYREKVVPAGAEVSVFVGPLRPGRYDFFDDFSPETEHGHIVVK